ncbi:DUF3800 domain-containing protein [Spiroplasma endosymbiont of Dactylopius coccus]|nr:DUF3800 domain-containing protein [Spiroplasma ixodetis]
MSNNEYWIFIDDSGNLELSDKETKYFVYGALLFNNKNDLENFKEEYEGTLIIYFGDNVEKKGADDIEDKKREKIYNWY